MPPFFSKSGTPIFINFGIIISNADTPCLRHAFVVPSLPKAKKRRRRARGTAPSKPTLHTYGGSSDVNRIMYPRHTQGLFVKCMMHCFDYVLLTYVLILFFRTPMIFFLFLLQQKRLFSVLYYIQVNTARATD